MSRLFVFTRYVSPALAVGLVLCGAALWLSNDFYLRILFMCGVYYLCAAGMNVLAGYAGQKSLGQAGLFAAGAYAVALLTTKLQLSPLIALMLAPVIAAAVGILIALPSLRVKGPSLALVTLAFGIVAEKLVTEWTDVFGGAQGIYGIGTLTWDGVPFSLQQWVFVVVALGVAVHLVLSHALKGKFGRALQSLQLDEIAAECAGISVYRYKTLAFVVAAALCGLGGALVAQQNQYFNSDFITFHLSVFILLLVLLGGAGTLNGPLAGAVVLTLADVFLAQWPSVQHFVYGAMLLFSLYMMPRGIVGVFERFRRTPSAPASDAAVVVMPALVSARKKQTPDAALLEVRGLCKSFGGVVTAKDVNLSMRGSQICALIRPNGAGKSTLINMLTGVIPPSSGSIWLHGENVTCASPHLLADAGIARTFQNLRLFASLSVLDNVLVGAHARIGPGCSESQARQRAMVVLGFAGLNQYAHAIAGSLPYGLQRRVELARAIAAEPALLLLDEPAAGLNPAETRELGQLIRKISALDISVLMVEHDMGMVMEISDHIIVLDRGVVIAEGPPLTIQKDPLVIEAYLGSEDPLSEEAIAC